MPMGSMIRAGSLVNTKLFRIAIIKSIFLDNVDPFPDRSSLFSSELYIVKAIPRLGLGIFL